ncbi:uncharacterized protein TRIVIDRAFT_221278 [Trichoderma virens Gv29-8]|uniref:Uncharacterized protein n=1 Tax=Hypocrea virens (strain Gv29-8 / FGSC 10586) TaxID=413071 RepID=G9MQ82_HYPVG|nr:uncharacterized protein TRIVIDRAFT_221278 [Trichoderma virens Gv29-8]EHK24029.1 hypothetical protein TRIVIDRAFT_221278 [Trichoderma virens Gv29-8]UKZ50341.1 hypothetical protein TrVGV298_004599 [Trichoderma virens]
MPRQKPSSGQKRISDFFQKADTPRACCNFFTCERVGYTLVSHNFVFRDVDNEGPPSKTLTMKFRLRAKAIPSAKAKAILLNRRRHLFGFRVIPESEDELGLGDNCIGKSNALIIDYGYNAARMQLVGALVDTSG